MAIPLAADMANVYLNIEDVEISGQPNMRSGAEGQYLANTSLLSSQHLNVGLMMFNHLIVQFQIKKEVIVYFT